MQVIHVLMTGAGAPGAPGIMHCLKKTQTIQLTVGDADPNATGRYLHSNFVTLLPANHPEYIDQLLNHCREKKIQVILPLVTRELFPLATNQPLFESNGIRVLVSPEGAIRIANNKSNCYQYLQEKGIAVPRFHRVNSVLSFEKAAASLGYPVTPFCFKPSLSNGSRGVRVVTEAINESELLFHQKPYHLFMNYKQAVEILASSTFPELLVSEYLPGDEYSVDCLALHGETKVVVPRKRVKMINGISVQGTFIKHEKIISYCSNIIKAIGLHGNIGIQIKMSANEEPLLLEVNPRVQGSIVTALGAGVNLPLLALQQEMGESPSLQEIEIKWGTRFSRYWTEVYY